jgi:hypothetical protein
MAGRQLLAALLLLAACAAQDSGPRYAGVEPERWKVRVGVPAFGERSAAAAAAATAEALHPRRQHCFCPAAASKAYMKLPIWSNLGCRLTPLLV